jgi:hypothetical protein
LTEHTEHAVRPAAAPVVAVEREAVLLADGLIWPPGITADQQATGIAQLLGTAFLCLWMA